MKVLFVCSGNICRSAMAEAYMRHALRVAGREDVEVSSAGTLGIAGSEASPEAVRAMEEIGVNLRGHRSRGVSEALLAAADVVVVMGRSHLEELGARFGDRGAPRHRMREFERSSRPAGAAAADLEDPMGRPLEVYRECRAILARSIDHLLAHLGSARSGEAG